MATIKMVGYVNKGELEGMKKVTADINEQAECVEQALKDGFQFVDEKDFDRYMKNKVFAKGV